MNIAAMCRLFIEKQRMLSRRNDPAALAPRTIEDYAGDRFRAHDLRALYVSEMLERGADPHTHQNVATMRKVYDRRRVIEVTPLA